MSRSTLSDPLDRADLLAAQHTAFEEEPQMSKRAFLTKTHLSRRDFLEKAAQAGAGLAGIAFLAACGSAAAPAGGDTGTTASTAASDAAASVAADAAPSAAAVAPEGGAGTISMLGWGSPLEKDNVEAGLKQFRGAESRHHRRVAAYPARLPDQAQDHAGRRHTARRVLGQQYARLCRSRYSAGRDR